MDVDRYITDEAVMAFMDARSEESSEYEFWVKIGLHAALPHIIPAIRAEVFAMCAKQASQELSAIRRVRDLHRELPSDTCEHDEDVWPCPTIRALDGE